MQTSKVLVGSYLIYDVPRVCSMQLSSCIKFVCKLNAPFMSMCVDQLNLELGRSILHKPVVA